jgi:hypothetical protein
VSSRRTAARGRLFRAAAYIRKCLAALGLVLILSAVAWPTSRARAYEDQLTLGADLGYAASFFHGEVGHGAVFGIVSTVGFADAWSVRGRFSYVIEPDPGPVHRILLGSDLVYLVDILELVPFTGAGIDGIGTLTGSDFDIDMGIHAAVGVDYLFSRSVIAGLEVRPLLVVSEIDAWPFYLFANITLSVIFDL